MAELTQAQPVVDEGGRGWPSVTVVLLVYNRKDELRTTLRKMLFELDYEPELVDVVVVDNASTDGSGQMVEREFPQVRLIRREENCGVSGFNDGFDAARGDWVLALDDDCYLPADGLKRALTAARETGVDLVSFGVRADDNPEYRFDHRYRTGLLTFWGCAVLMRREVLDRLHGYDPEIFVWANELEFMLRFFDAGFAHLHLPEVVAVHMKPTGRPWQDYIAMREYRLNTRHFAYIAAKALRPSHAAGTLVALLAGNLRDAWRVDRAALKAIPGALRGFANGLRHRDPVSSAEISATYRRNFYSFASPWWVSRPLPELLRSLPRELGRTVLKRDRDPARPNGRRDAYYAQAARYYPKTSQTLRF
ncbi:MAG: glycosyltransferase family 2 protein [Thermoleophilaceae bacterium]